MEFLKSVCRSSQKISSKRFISSSLALRHLGKDSKRNCVSCSVGTINKLQTAVECCPRFQFALLDSNCVNSLNFDI